MHFVSCQDPVLFRLNTAAVNNLVKTMQKVRTAGIISCVFQNIIGALRKEKEPIEPIWKQDEMGEMGALAWQEQSQIGWDHMLKGRLSKTWGRMQQWYYRQHPELRDKKGLTGAGWMVRMINSLTTMTLTMWQHRCGCMHGHTEHEKKQRKKDTL